MPDVVSNREKEARAARDQGLEEPQYDDAVAWTQSDPRNSLPAGDIQLALAMAALFTTTRSSSRSQNPELVEPLRQEIRQSLSDHGLGLAVLAKMELLHYVLKESQRQIPVIGWHGNTQGILIMVDSRDMWSPEVYDDPKLYDGYRFSKRRQARDKASRLVQSSREHNVFGGGRHISPGRFFASNELKYDIRLKDSYCSRPVQFGVYTSVEPVAQLEIRPREEYEDCLLLD
ncbi:hypothetical protein N7526_006722, partial [Penicillium atrosanguineum]